MSLNEDKLVAKQKTRRLFFALWPEDKIRTNIRKHLKKILQHGGGKRVADHNLHITLSFLGSIDEQQQACAEQFANTLAFDPVELCIDKAGYWSKPKVLWAGCTDVPQYFSDFTCKLNQGMRQCGINVDSRPFVPHITLMRKVNKAPQDLEFKAFQWKATNIVLVESRTLQEGVQYNVIKKW